MKLVKNDLYLLLIDRDVEIKEKDYVFDIPKNIFFIVKSFGQNGGKTLIEETLDYSTPYEVSISNCKKLIAYYPLTKEAKELDLPLLPSFEVDIEKLAEDRYGKYGASIDIPNKYLREGFIDGYKAAQSKQFSLEDMIAFGKKCFYKGFDKSENDDANSFTAWREECSKLIQSLSTQQFPKEFKPLFEIYDFDYGVGRSCIPRKILKTITNSEGKQEIQGTYKY